MTLEEAIKHCEEVAEKYCEKVEEGLTADDFCDSCASEHRQLAEWLKELKAYREAWIPVSERLPKKTGKYLVTVRNGNVYAGTFDETSGRFQCAATAWMPLPKPYEEQSETVQMHDPLIDEVVKSGAPFKKWLESFNTESASVCFNKIQELKGIVGAGSEKNTQGVYDGHITS